MKTYLVGGAVRDQMLGLPVKERDWVVVGATPAEMLALGYRPVGKDFPVFLHPLRMKSMLSPALNAKQGLVIKDLLFMQHPM